MKKISALLSSLVIWIVILSSCSQKHDYTHVIPSDATVVASANPLSLFRKSGLLTASEEAKQKVINVLEYSTSPETFQHFAKVFNSPFELGIDFTSRIYAFTSPAFNNPVWILKVKDMLKITKTFDLLANEQLCEPINKRGDLSYVIIGQSYLLVYNDYAAAITSGTSAMDVLRIEDEMSKLMLQTKKNSIANTPAFEKFSKQHGDIDFMTSLATIPDIYSQQLKAGFGLSIDDLTQMKALGKVNFERGKIAMQLNYFTDDKKIESLLKQQTNATKAIEESFLAYYPDSTIALACVGANGKAMYNLILDNKDLRDILPSSNSEIAKTMFDAFDGDITIGITHINLNATSTFVAYADITKNSDILKIIYQNKDSLLSNNQEIIRYNDDNYLLKVNNFDVYYGIKGETMYATNDSTYLDKLYKEANPSIKQASYVKEMRNKNLFVMVNIADIINPSVMGLLGNINTKEYNLFYDFITKIEYFEMSNTVNNVSEIDLVFKNTETNSLKQIIDSIRQFIGM